MPQDERTPDRLTVALAWISARQARDRVLGADLFINPAWDILLDLYVNHAENKPQSIGNVCLATTAPTTTAWRWISLLEGRGLLTRSKDPTDARRSFISLTPEGLIQMERALDASADSDRRLGLGRVRMIQKIDH